jgi:acetylornithine/succinyldiaminopimelate/putrescine aminotransferase
MEETKMIKNVNISLNQYAVQAKGNIVSDMGGEKVMLSVENGKYYNFGECGGEIWDLMKEKISVNQMVEALISNYEIEQSDCEEQVISFLDELLAEGLIEVSEEAN